MKFIVNDKREEATSALPEIRALPLSWSDWNLEMLDFPEGGKPENLEKNPLSKVRTKKKLNQHIVPGQNQTWPTLMGGKCHQHCAIPALPRKTK